MDDSRRRWLTSAVAVASGAAGAAIGWRHWQPGPATSEAQAKLWQHRFTDLEGQTQALSRWAGRPLLLNFWATWCPPCVEEMPMLDAFYAVHSSRCTIIGLAIDQRPAVHTFVQQRQIRYPVMLAGPDGLLLAKSLGNDAGGLPFSAFFDNKGALVHSKVGKLSESDLSAWL